MRPSCRFSAWPHAYSCTHSHTQTLESTVVGVHSKQQIRRCHSVRVVAAECWFFEDTSALPRTCLNPQDTKSCHILCLPHLDIFFFIEGEDGKDTRAQIPLHKSADAQATHLENLRKKVLFYVNNLLSFQTEVLQKYCNSGAVLLQKKKPSQAGLQKKIK